MNEARLLAYLTKLPHDPHNVLDVSPKDRHVILLSIPEAARMWRIPERTLRHRIRRAGITPIAGRYDVDQLEDIATASRARPRIPDACRSA